MNIHIDPLRHAMGFYFQKRRGTLFLGEERQWKKSPFFWELDDASGPLSLIALEMKALCYTLPFADVAHTTLADFHFSHLAHGLRIDFGAQPPALSCEEVFPHGVWVFTNHFTARERNQPLLFGMLVGWHLLPPEYNESPITVKAYPDALKCS